MVVVAYEFLSQWDSAPNEFSTLSFRLAYNNSARTLLAP